MAYEQSTRQASVTVSGVTDLVVIQRFSASERLSELFTFIVDVIAPDGTVDFAPALGNSVSITMPDATGIARYFSGLLFEAEFISATDEGWHYRLVLRPWCALLAGNRGLQIFQSMSVLDILNKVISDAGYTSSYTPKAQGSYPVRTFCVQYRESSFAFLSRLMEEEGLYYFFEHTSDGKHKLIVCDATSEHPYASGLTQVPYIAGAGDDRTTVQPHLWHWSQSVRPGAGKVTLRDYDFQQPSNNFETANSASGSEAPAEQAELYDYPGRYGVYAAGQMGSEQDRYSLLRLQASRAERQRCTGHGDAFALACGAKFSLTQHPDDTQNQEYLTIGTTHMFTDESYRSGNAAAGFHLDVAVEVIPSSTQWRAPLRTPKPVAGGPQTATVVGPSGQVIYVDQYGRVKVQFHWDRLGNMDENSSCWIRVSQAWGDAGFGTMMIPRIGEEVIVDFIDGDPDRPIITGRVYNPQCGVPYPLPDNQNVSTWKSATVGQSGPYPDTEDPPPADGGYNEIRYNDTGGSEELGVHAQRDFDAWIRHDETRKVGHDATFRVGHTRTSYVHVNDFAIVETGDESRTVKQGNYLLNVQTGNHSTWVNNDRNTTIIDGNDTTVVETGYEAHIVLQGNFAVNAAEQCVNINAGQAINLSVGNNTITIDQTGVTINGLMVTINADAIITIKAPLVMVN